MKTRMKRVLTNLAAGVIGSIVLFGCGSGSSDTTVSPGVAPQTLQAEPPSAVPKTTPKSTAVPQSFAGVPSTDFETPPGAGSTRHTP